MCVGGHCVSCANAPSQCPVICLSNGNCGPCAGNSDCEAVGGFTCCAGKCDPILLPPTFGPCTDGCQCTSGVCTGGTCDFSGGGGDCSEDGCGCQDDSTCDSDYCAGGKCGEEDPIVIDIAGQGYELTNAQNGVKFDFFATGKPIQMSWTAGAWDGGFLALDRNGNGKIDNGMELFGNVTPQPKPAAGKANGFLALAVFDQPANGGNGDGIIDSRDAIYSKLVVWVDKNHNGISDPGELITLQQAGIQSISLKYDKNSWTDMYGNKFRYRASLMRSAPINPAQQWVYDVILKGGGKGDGGH